MVWQTNQTDLSQKICSPLGRHCRQIKQIDHMQYVLYQNGIVDKSNRPIIDTVLAIRAVLQENQTDISQTICSLLERYCRQMKQTYHRHYVLCQNVLQTNQAYLSWTICSILERYCRQIKQNYHRHCFNYQSGIVDKSNKPIIDTVLTIRTVLQTNQTDLSQTICSLL